MSEKARLSLNPAALRDLLEGEKEFEPPAAVLAGLSGEQACARVDGTPHSIAELVAHMLFWQERRIAFARGGNPPREEVEAGDWVEVKPAEWAALRQRFLASAETLAQCAADPAAQDRGLPYGRNAGLALASQASHNAYHLGQIVLLRRLLGRWPPAGE